MKDDAILIVGSGAVACLFAARLAAAGVKTTMLATWEEAVNIIRENGVRVQYPDGIEQKANVVITRDPSELGLVRRAIVLVKAWQTQRTAEQLKICLAEDGLVLTLQNGFGNIEVLQAVLGEHRAAAGIMVLGTSLLEPGFVRATKGAEIKLENDPRLDSISALLKQSGFSVDTVENLLALQWGKLVVNAAINPLSAMLQIPNGDLLENRYAYTLLKELAVEAEMTAHACGVALPFANTMDFIEDVIRKTSANFSSMLQDLMRNAPTEIEAITGSLIRLAGEVGVSVPVNQCIYQLIKAAEQRGKR